MAVIGNYDSVTFINQQKTKTEIDKKENHCNLQLQTKEMQDNLTTTTDADYLVLKQDAQNAHVLLVVCKDWYLEKNIFEIFAKLNTLVSNI